MRIAHIVGNRPQFIKLSLICRQWQLTGGMRPLIIHTGQHFHDNMSAIFFEQFGLPDPDYQLGIHSLPHNIMIGKMLEGIDPILAAERPDMVIVYGDTNTTLAGALAAKKRQIPLAHVEAGIRTGNEEMPEESNRYLTDRMADFNFACTGLGLDNLTKEGQTAVHEQSGQQAWGRVNRGANGSGTGGPMAFLTGDLMLDAALYFKDKAREQSSIIRDLGLGAGSGHVTGTGGRAGAGHGSGYMAGPGNAPFVLATIHRAENAEDPRVLGGIMDALNHIHQEIPVVLPVHPKTRQLIDRYELPVSVITTPPLGYFDMLTLVQGCRHVITDSGGLSREAFFFCKPALVVMEHPFWPEILEHGPGLRSGPGREDILASYARLRQGGKPFETGVFGDGRAAEHICSIIREGLHV